jgi:methionyl aminopeptidase
MGSFADRFKRVVKDNNLTPEQEAKYQSFKKRGYRVPSKRLIKSASDIEGIRASGVINTGVLDYVAERIKAGVSTAEIDRWVYDYTTEHGAIPAPLNYEGFPKSVCVSINHVVCHGIPSEDTILKDGDIVNVDESLLGK